MPVRRLSGRDAELGFVMPEQETYTKAFQCPHCKKYYRSVWDGKDYIWKQIGLEEALALTLVYGERLTGLCNACVDALNPSRKSIDDAEY
jgi:hypothetical protein